MAETKPIETVGDLHEHFDAILESWLKWASIKQLEAAHEAIRLALARAADEASRDARAKAEEARAAQALVKNLGIRPKKKTNGQQRKPRWDKGLKRIVIPVPETPTDEQASE